MTSRTTRAVTLAGALSLVVNPLADLDNVAKRTFNEFFGNGKPTITKPVTTRDYGVALTYAEDSNGLDGKIDTTTYWTPEKLREVIKDGIITFIYWRIEGAEQNTRGDRFLKDVLNQYGHRFDRIIQIEGRKYGYEKNRKLREVLDEFNKRSQDSTHTSPIYSITGFGFEVRIDGAPREPYQKSLDEVYKPGLDRNLPWFENKKREKFLHTGQK